MEGRVSNSDNFDAIDFDKELAQLLFGATDAPSNGNGNTGVTVISSDHDLVSQETVNVCTKNPGGFPQRKGTVSFPSKRSFLFTLTKILFMQESDKRGESILLKKKYSLSACALSRMKQSIVVQIVKHVSFL